MTLFLLRRLYGVAQVVDGVVTIFTPWRTGLPLRVARDMARYRGRVAQR